MPAETVDPAAPLFVILNAGSGRQGAADTRATVERVLAGAGRAHAITLVTDPTELVQIARAVVARARGAGGVVVATGGDGTLNAVAHATLGSGCAFGVLPQGTFNYFGRAHGIPDDAEAATRLLLTARAHPVQVGLVNDRIFLVNASLGLYPQLLEDREAYNRQYGRSRFGALAAGIATLLTHRRNLHVNLEHSMANEDLATRTLFVGNNVLQLEQIGIPLAPAVGEGRLVAIALRPVGTPAMLWLLLRGALGQLGEADNVRSFAFGALTVRRARLFRARRMKVATDGEVAWLVPPIEFRVSPEPLQLLKPEPVAAPPGAVVVGGSA